MQIFGKKEFNSLLIAAANKSEEAYRRILNAYNPLLLKYSTDCTGNFNEDLYQIQLGALYRAILKFAKELTNVH